MIRIWRNLGTLDRHRASKATQKGHIHIHNGAAWASIGDITPAEYRRRQKRLPRQAKQKRLSARLRFLQKQTSQSQSKINKKGK